MVNQGTDFGSDLWDLMKVARSHIPAMASAFEAAAGHVMDTGTMDDDAMSLRVRSSFQELRNEYHRLLAESQDSMQKTSTTLVEVINDYAATDEAAAEQLRNLIGEYNANHDQDFPNADPGGTWEVPSYQDPAAMREVDDTNTFRPDNPVGTDGPMLTEEVNAPDDEK